MLVQFRVCDAKLVFERHDGFAARCEAAAMPRRVLVFGALPRGGAPLI